MRGRRHSSGVILIEAAKAARRGSRPRLSAQPLQRRAEARASLFGLGATLALLLDDFLGRARHEVGIAELDVDLADLVGELLDFLLQARAFGFEVDDVSDRQ